jgi:hypothetical protein
MNSTNVVFVSLCLNACASRCWLERVMSFYRL